ncbi:hypothetical protein [Pseudaestuariivita atlantica]|uniref:5-carboxymethyl-2-hydroxymuconate isomerase n=1 Tax=Pseudaestuariivita atlantica TaxID=1317121 RepID=A0A0L1JST6_9RHOB|nr:hypothetical protein [Pseudaestuariivita atlantica]KNG94826.1 hypothetical protein ATO11_05420 [Pseudaestuariivita atlantica]
MPHATLSYSADLDIDAPALLQEIEEILNAHDPGAGPCKGRAYPAQEFLHTHVLIRISALSKPHRDAAFTAALLSDLEMRIKARLSQACYFTLAIDYSGPNYVTNRFTPEA